MPVQPFKHLILSEEALNKLEGERALRTTRMVYSGNDLRRLAACKFTLKAYLPAMR